VSALAGAIAVVSGASRGIGRAVAEALVADGARVVMLARGAQALHDVAADIGDGAIAMPCDVGDVSAVTRVTEAILREHGVPAILVNNAGVFRPLSIEGTSPEEFETTLAVNLTGPFALVRAFLSGMRARGSGHIVTIGSISDRHIYAENSAYNASKFGLRALHETLRAETRGSGVRASLVSPAPVDTPIWDAVDPDNRQGFTPRSRMLSAEAVADAVRFVVTRPATTNIEELRVSRS
jgi:NADP-dependent 3-hydroxy acid dehydrogenase YdfG